MMEFLDTMELGSVILEKKIDYNSTSKALRYSKEVKKNDYSKIFYVLKDRNSIARNRQFYNLVKASP